MEKSLFEEKNKVILETRNLQDTTQTMTGPVQQPLDMQQDQNLNANHIQVEENLQKLEVEQNLELLTDAEREMAIEKAYEEHKKGTQLAALDKKSKRAKNMKKKVEYWKKSKSFKPPEPENLGKLISEAGDVSDYSMEEGAANLEAEIRALKIKNDKAFSDNMESNFAILAKLDKFKAEFCKAVNTKKLQNLKSNRCVHVRNAIAMGEQVKKYMIAQQQLMQNPYYTMLAKKDVAGLSNEELEKKANTVQNPVLADYYRKVLNVRNSGFERSKGMDAAYANAAKLVEDGKDNVEELLKTGKKAVEQKQKKDNEDKFVKRARMAEEARIKREANKKDAKVQATIKKYREAHITEYNKKVEEQNREIEAQDPEFAEYKILNSYDVWEKIQENPANDMSTDEYQQIYGHNFQFEGPRADTAYIKTGNAAIINTYIRNRKAGLKAKRKVYEDQKVEEGEIEQKLKEWEEGIKDTIALLKQSTKHDKIPQKCRLYRMCGDYVLKNLGLNTMADKQTLVDQLNKKAGTVFKEQNFSSTGYRGDGDYFGVLKSPIMLTILCEEGQKCFITANQRETEIIFDKPEFEIVKAELADENHAKKIPLSSNKLVQKTHGLVNFNTETTGEYKGGIHLVVRLKRSDGDDPKA